jgi:hypothetical protein
MTPKEYFNRFKGHWFDASFLDVNAGLKIQRWPE